MANETLSDSVAADAAWKVIRQVQRMHKRVVYIHYSCGAFDVSSPSENIVFSICVKEDRIGGKTHTFCDHRPQRAMTNYDEKKVLSDFAKYVKQHPNAVWVHWNMRNEKFGWEHLALRAANHQLRGFPKGEQIECIDLPDLLWKIYGEFADHPRFTTLGKLNGIDPKGLLSAEDEAMYRTQKKYFKLHENTRSRVELIQGIFHRLAANELIVATQVKEKTVETQGPEQALASARLPGNSDLAVRHLIKTTKGAESIALQLLLDNPDGVEIRELKDKCGWQDLKKSFENLQTRLNAKLKKKGFMVRSWDAKARLIPVDEPLERMPLSTGGND